MYKLTVEKWFATLENGFLNEDEQPVQNKKFLMKKLKNDGVWYLQDQEDLNIALNEMDYGLDYANFTVALNLEEIVKKFEAQGIELDRLVSMATSRHGNIVEIFYDNCLNTLYAYVGIH